MAVNTDTVADIDADGLASGTDAITDGVLSSILEAFWALEPDAYTEDSKVRLGYLLTGAQDLLTTAGVTPSNYALNSGKLVDLLVARIEAIRYRVNQIDSGFNSFLYYDGAPPDTFGSDGDTCLNGATGALYTKASGTWTATGDSLIGPTGATGAAGELSGTAGAANTVAKWDGSGNLVEGTGVTINDASFTGFIKVAASALTSSASITIDMNDGQAHEVTLAHNTTFANPSNLAAGQYIHLTIIQDGTGSRTAAWGSYWNFPGGTAPTLSTGAGDVDIITGRVRSATAIDCTFAQDMS